MECTIKSSQTSSKSEALLLYFFPFSIFFSLFYVRHHLLLGMQIKCSCSPGIGASLQKTTEAAESHSKVSFELVKIDTTLRSRKGIYSLFISQQLRPKMALPWFVDGCSDRNLLEHNALTIMLTGYTFRLALWIFR